MSFVIGFKHTILQVTSEVASKIANKLPFNKKQEDDLVDDFVVVPRHKYTLEELSQNLAKQRQELMSIPEFEEMQLKLQLKLQLQLQLQQSPSSAAMQHVNAELQEIYELQQKNVESMKKRQALLQNNVELMKQVHAVCNSIYDWRIQ